MNARLKPAKGAGRGPGKPFQKGQVANPLGGKAHNKDVKVVRKLTQKELSKVMAVILKGDTEELQEMREDPKSNVLTVWICAVALKAISRGDAQALNALLDRVVGRPQQNVKLSGAVNRPVTEEDVKKADEYRRKIQAEY